eukprot:2796364-Prymnesium_polylepis.2
MAWVETPLASEDVGSDADIEKGEKSEEQEGGGSELTWNECEEERREEQSEEEAERGAGGE